MKQSGGTSPQATQPPSPSPATAVTEDIAVFAVATTPTENTSLVSDDTRRRPFSVDYHTKYQQLAPGEDDSYLQYDAELDDTESNA